MNQLSSLYIVTQKYLIALEHEINIYEESAQQTQDAIKIIDIFAKAFGSFCQLLAHYAHEQYQETISNPASTAGLKALHHKGIFSEHDLRILLEALAQKDTLNTIKPNQEIPLIHNIQTYHDTMQAIVATIKL